MILKKRTKYHRKAKNTCFNLFWHSVLIFLLRKKSSTSAEFSYKSVARIICHVHKNTPHRGRSNSTFAFLKRARLRKGHSLNRNLTRSGIFVLIFEPLTHLSRSVISEMLFTVNLPPRSSEVVFANSRKFPLFKKMTQLSGSCLIFFFRDLVWRSRS